MLQAVVYDEINTPEHVEWCDNTNKDLGKQIRITAEFAQKP